MFPYEIPVKLTGRFYAKIINPTRQYEAGDKSLAITNDVPSVKIERKIAAAKYQV